MVWADSPHKTIGVNFDLAFGTELQGHHTYFDLQFTDGVRCRHVKGSPTGRLASRAVQNDAYVDRDRVARPGLVLRSGLRTRTLPRTAMLEFLGKGRGTLSYTKRGSPVTLQKFSQPGYLKKG